MSMITDLQGRLRNTNLPNTKGLLPIFEAVINSIHAIEDVNDKGHIGQITVEVIRDKQQSLFDGKPLSERLEHSPLNDILEFKVHDNGIGLTNENMQSFNTLDSSYKAHKGGRGVGRLLWLKAFKKVSIQSVFKGDEGILKMRSFHFDPVTGISDMQTVVAQGSDKIATTVHLLSFLERYRKYAPKKLDTIASSLFEHCLWYFVREGSAPNIIIKDGIDALSLKDIYERHMSDEASIEKIYIKGNAFELMHIKLRSLSSLAHCISYCASNRLVEDENLTGKIPGLFDKIADDQGNFTYTCYVTSPFLDEAVRPERTGFDIDEKISGLFSDTELTFREIREAVIERSKFHLKEYLAENKRIGRERVEEFVAKKAPRYRPILKRIPEDALSIDPKIADKEIELTLHRHLFDIESKMLSEGHDVLVALPDEDYKAYRDRLQNYLNTARDIKMSDLANYVFHRRVVIEILEKAIRIQDDGRYARENLIHNLIMPMGSDSNDVMLDNCNLWLIDERLAFHDYLASDKPLTSMPVTDSTEKDEPDMLGVRVWDNPLLVSEGESVPLASIVVVEIKRPMRKDASEGEKDPIVQALKYLNKVRQGNVKTKNQRPIPKSENIPGFCYVICDLTPSVESLCISHDAIRTSDGLGYFYYHKNFKAYVEVISYDRLVNASKERNKAFFDKLGLPTT